MKNSDILDQIEQYVEGKMSDAELREFEYQLKSDAILAAKMEAYNLAVAGIKNKGREELKSKLKFIHDEVIAESENRKFNYHQLIRIAAIFAVTAIMATYFIYFRVLKPKTNKEDLFTEYFSPYFNANSTRGDNADKITFLHKTAMYFYSNKEYAKAVLNFEELISTSKDVEPEIMFYYGISCLGINKNTKAIEVFSKLVKDKTSVFNDQSTWYLALAFLQNNDIPQTRTTLRAIIKSKTSYTEKALDLLEKID